jgi:hypothetical protein
MTTKDSQPTKNMTEENDTQKPDSEAVEPASAGSVSMPDEVMLKIWCLDLSGGDLQKAQKLHDWLNPHNKMVPAARLTQALAVIRNAKGIPPKARWNIRQQLQEAGCFEDEE